MATQPAQRPVLTIVDGHALAYRYHYAMLRQNLTDREGQPIGAVYGFTQFILDQLHQQPDYFLVTFDQGLSYRDALYPDYKAHRDDMPEDLAQQLDKIQAMLVAFNIPIYMQAPYEADDVIGTLTQQAIQQGFDVCIISGDEDLLQLLNEHVTVMLKSSRGKETTWTVGLFREKKGLSPDQWIDYKALVGDSSDNIPGVKGVGDKGATGLLQAYQTLEALFEQVNGAGISNNRYQKNLVGQEEIAYLSRQLATILCDLDAIQLDIQQAVPQDFDPTQVLALFEQYDFGARSRDKLEALISANLSHEALEAYQEATQFDPDYQTILSRDDLTQMVSDLAQAQIIAFDTETSGLDKMQADLVGISLSGDGHKGYYIPIGHTPPQADVKAENEGGQLSLFEAPPEDAPSSPDTNQIDQQLPLVEVIAALRPLLTDPTIPKVAHNAVFDLIILRRHGLDVTPIQHDTMLAEYVRQPDSAHLGLKRLALRELNIQMQDITELIGTGRSKITMPEVPIHQAAPYAAADAIATHRLATQFIPKLQKDGTKTVEIYHQIEMPLMPILATMEMHGVLIDQAHFRELSQDFNARLATIEQQIHALAGREFLINSPKQLNEVLFGDLQLNPYGLRKTKSGDFSLNAAALEGLLEQDLSPQAHQLIEAVLAYRGLAKLNSTYVDAMLNLVNPHTGRIHTSFNQTGTVTGRLSSSDPNLQNIPIRTAEGRRVRQGFIAPTGHKLISIDYSQIELRILAHVSDDDALKQAFQDGQDIHRATAAKVHNLAPEDVTYEQRRFAKAVNFGLMYGMGAYRLARDSDLTFAEAEAFIKAYFQNFPSVQDYLDGTKAFARQYGYVQNLYGRRRYFPEFQRDTANANALSRAEREAINAPIQGTAADIMKQAMIVVDERLRSAGLDAKLLLQVHDELVLEAPDDDLDAVEEVVTTAMIEAGQAKLNVPIEVDIEVGQNWAGMT